MQKYGMRTVDRYLDFAMGIAVCNTGHRHPKVVQAAKDQIDQYTHTAFQVSAYEPYITLAERLNEAAPIRRCQDRVFLHRRRGGGKCHQDRPR